MKIENSVALVTGANRGIGRAFVEALLARGARHVYAASRTAETSPGSHLDKRVETLRLDITDRLSVQAAADRAAGVTLLINNAGVLASGAILTSSVDDLRRDVETNYFGTLNMTRAFAPVLARNGNGAIVNVLTIVSLASMPGIAGYCASKAAAYSLTQAIRAELASQGTRVFGVFPGPVDTDMLRAFDMPKTPPLAVAHAALAGVEADEEDVLPDPRSREIYSAWLDDPKAVERQFGAM